MRHLDSHHFKNYTLPSFSLSHEIYGMLNFNDATLILILIFMKNTLHSNNAPPSFSFPFSLFSFFHEIYAKF
jgi:hypothetical protein